MGSADLYLMLSELIFLNAVLSRWLKTPAAPICEISLETRDKRARPYFREEIRAMRSSMKSSALKVISQCFTMRARLFIRLARGRILFIPST